jgi:hypothetical protein
LEYSIGSSSRKLFIGFGLGGSQSRALESRLEFCCQSSLKSRESVEALLLGSLQVGQVSREASLVYLFWPEFSYSLKSWRKIRGLPSRGQRTWSNASGPESGLKEFRLKKGKLLGLFYSDLLMQDTSAAVGAEQVNMYWLRQWGSEWLQGSLSFSASRKKRRGRQGLDFDLSATAKG